MNKRKLKHRITYRILFWFLLLTCFGLNVFGQSSNALDYYKYISISPSSEQRANRAELKEFISKYFLQKGLPTIPSDNYLRDNPNDVNEILYCTFYSFSGGPPVYYESIITFTDSNNKTILTAQARNTVNWSLGLSAHKNVIEKALSTCFYNYKYKYYVDQLPIVERINITEDSLRKYLTSTPLDPLEGIYKSIQNDSPVSYKIGIIRKNFKFLAIIIESNLDKVWKQGDVKAYFEPTSAKGIYSTSWYMTNKRKVETISILENDIIISTKFTNPQTREETTDKLLKLFPLSEDTKETIPNEIAASASGFLLTTDGYIATNAHVISNAKKIEVCFSANDKSTIYKAVVALKDIANDIAILKSVDDNFKQIGSIPYMISEKPEVGEDVFTIGYPMNSVMGSNYKVTNGIVSSLTGIADDIRYMQISVPLQPGNSGGPLFNKNGNVLGITSAKLNEKVIGTSIENVSYAIKATYLINMYKMLPSIPDLNAKSSLTGLELKDQVKILKDYVCLINIY
jgi:S1-C subfamily serine protease